MNATPFSQRDYLDIGFHKSYWAQDHMRLAFSPATGAEFDLIIIGSGYTGLSAAISAAPHLSTLVIERNTIGSGCSSRNGGDLCYGGTFLNDKALAQQYGEDAPEVLHAFSARGVSLVKTEMEDAGHSVHGQHEYAFIHNKALQKQLSNTEDYMRGIDGLPHAPFGICRAEGYAINPRRYLETLFKSAKAKGTVFREQFEVTKIERTKRAFQLQTNTGETFTAQKVLVATNGYSNAALLPSLSRIIWPIRSNIIVTKPIEAARFEALGWTLHDPLYDTRKLLHYFRKLPDNRILFGMRGALGFEMDQNFKTKVKNNFDTMFPSLADVEVDYFWSGLIAMTRQQIPYISEIEPGVFAAFGYHGNGIALGSIAGREIGKKIAGLSYDIPEFLTRRPRPFPPSFVMRNLVKLMAQGYRIRDGKITALAANKN